MNLVFICQAVDREDPLLAGTLRWIRAFAADPRIDRLDVLALRVGACELPERTTVRALRRRSRAATLLAFYRAVTDRLREGADAFFVYQGGPYPALLAPVRWLCGRAVFQWKAHPVVTRATALQARWCLDRVFTSTRGAFPLALPTVRVVGQGVDTERFSVPREQPSGDLVTVGRVSPVKRIEAMLAMLAACREHYGHCPGLDIYGPTTARDTGYQHRLLQLVDELGLRRHVRFLPPIRHDDVPAVLARYRVFAFFCAGALGRAAVEAMACGLPVLTTNSCVAEILPEELRGLLVAPANDPERQARALNRLLAMPETARRALGASLARLVRRDHAIDGLVRRIVDEIATCL